MTPIRTPALRAVRSLGVSLMVIALAGCAGAATAKPSSTPLLSPSAATPTPTPTLRTGYDLPPFAELVKLFDYDRTEPLGYTVTSQERQGDATVYDIKYANGGYSVLAKLVIPDGKGPFPAVLYAAGHTMDPSVWLPDMVALAKDGYAGLAIGERPTIDLYSSLDGKATIEGYRDYVVDLRRGVDLLGTHPKIDAKRLGFVGHSLGCAVGSILSGIETRIAAYALMACGGYITDPLWSYCGSDACSSASDEDRSQYQERLAVLNPVNYIGHSAGAAFLVQASKADQIASVPNVEALFAAAPEPKSLAWYEGGHLFGCTAAPCDPALPVFAGHRAWLKEHV